MSVFLQRQTVQRRRRWIKRLRQLERALLASLVVLAGLFALYGLYRAVFLGSVFRIEKIVAEGNWRRLNAQSVAWLAGVARGDNLFWMSVAEVHARLREEPWIKEAAVRRKLPDTLWIYVEEATPVGILADGALSYVDSEGRVIVRASGAGEKDLPVFTGISAGAQGDLSEEDAAHLREMVELLPLLQQSTFLQERGIAEVHYDARRGCSIVTRRTPMQVFLGQSDLAERLARIDRMWRVIGERQGRIHYMLANEQGRIVVGYRPS
jgi:cell division protein FtsQ